MLLNFDTAELNYHATNHLKALGKYYSYIYIYILYFIYIFIYFLYFIYVLYIIYIYILTGKEHYFQ